MLNDHLYDAIDEAVKKGLAERIKQTVDQTADGKSIQSRSKPLLGNVWLDGGVINSLFHAQRSEIDIAPVGYLSRDLQLRRLWMLHGNEVIQGAITAIIQKLQTNEWVIEGPKRAAKVAQELLKNADLGNGWEQFLAKIIVDYLTQDNGMFWELIWDSKKPDGLPGPNDSIIGIAHLDAMRCRRTGDPDFPVIYHALTGDMHKLHYSRVIYAADLPSPNERWLGRGLCALSRCVAVAQATIQYSQYRVEMLDDMPPLGLLVLSNINRKYWDETLRTHEFGRMSKEESKFSNILTMFNMDPTQKAEANLVPFRQLWQNFEEQSFYEMQIDLVAMAFGLDRQEIAALTTHGMGTGSQSTVLAQKSRGKGVGNLMSLLERLINQLLPKSCTFHFDYHDDEQDFQQAQIHAQKANTIIALYTASGGKPAADPVQRDRPLAGDSLTKDFTPQSDSNKPALPTTPANEGPLLDRREARYLLMKAGILEPEMVVGDDNIEPDDVMLDDVETTDLANDKAFKRYGMRVVIHKNGRIKKFPDNGYTRRKVAITDDEIEKARQNLKVMGFEF